MCMYISMCGYIFIHIYVHPFISSGMDIYLYLIHVYTCMYLYTSMCKEYISIHRCEYIHEAWIYIDPSTEDIYMYTCMWMYTWMWKECICIHRCEYIHGACIYIDSSAEDIYMYTCMWMYTWMWKECICIHRCEYIHGACIYIDSSAEDTYIYIHVYTSIHRCERKAYFALSLSVSLSLSLSLYMIYIHICIYVAMYRCLCGREQRGNLDEFMKVYICISILYKYVSIHIYTWCIYTYMYIDACRYVIMYIYIYMHICVYIYIYIRMYI